MTEEVFKAPKNKRFFPKSFTEVGSSPHKKKRTKEDFMDFCTIVLTYTQYDAHQREELRTQNNMSPLDSSGSTAESYASESSSSAMSLSEQESLSPSHDQFGFQSPDRLAPTLSDDDADLITCFCMKPYSGRPMIECSECATWIHLSCAKIRKTNIPDTYMCQKCRDAKFTTRKSSRMRTESKRIST
ncbi:PHD finger protein 13-like [Gigantopelta aegis]|uniref:PHD finger protein 13-like n=1 Tax=Gigantopelta aegis TaxID=1735272 RepID=UPI001B887833|nr:PHD finger protein 13-like [Gigantopelta aegis]